MLKSTYRVAAPDPTDAPLPAGWTEHKAPTGHSYYYNASTQQSTYTRPAPASEEPLQIDYGATEPDQVMRASMQVMDQFNLANTAQPQAGHFTGGRSYQDHSRRRGNQGDRPKTKAPIPDCAPWLLVKTKLNRRFVHNTETKQSLWKFPQDIMMKVIEMDRLEWEAKKKAEEAQKDKPVEAEPEKTAQASEAANSADISTAERPPRPAEPQDYDSDSYEEVEVTDDEGDADQEGAEPSKRPRLTNQEDQEAPPSGPVEFNEDDIAWQLAPMEADAQSNYSDYDNLDPETQEVEDEDEGLPLTDQDNIALFRSLLDSSTISPYSTFERLIEDTRVVEDPRYIALPTVSARKEAFSAWSKDRIAELQALKAEQSGRSDTKKRDPRVEYLVFLHKTATPKLYYPEHKRKYKRAPEMTDRAFAEKDREKLYRELVAKLKLNESDRRKDLVRLLKDTAKAGGESFRRSMSLDELPEVVVRDVRFYTLEEGRRDELVGTFLETL